MWKEERKINLPKIVAYLSSYVGRMVFARTNDILPAGELLVAVVLDTHLGMFTLRYMVRSKDMQASPLFCYFSGTHAFQVWGVPHQQVLGAFSCALLL